MRKLTFALILLAFHSLAQDTDPLVLNDDARYFDFWEGTWYVMKDDDTIDTTSYFRVRRSVHPASFIEEWQFGSNKMKSTALRAWDKTNKKWGFVWVSDNGLFQVWDARKVDGHWYLFKTFTIKGDTYLSRQGFLPQPDGTVIRVSEKSYDEKSWELRFRQRLKKAPRN
jgi:hypothetical protein